jgi:hypothetical protein
MDDNTENDEKIVGVPSRNIWHEFWSDTRHLRVRNFLIEQHPQDDSAGASRRLFGRSLLDAVS